VIKEEKEAIILLVYNERMQDKENMWYLNSGANNHVWRPRQVHGV
jgi:hypothetical protein